MRNLRLGCLRLIHLAVALLILGAVLLFPIRHTQALELDNRSVVVSTARPSVLATHLYSFIYESPGLLGSFVFEYCDNSPLLDQPCNAPPGLDVTAASLDSQSGNTGFSVDGVDTTSNKLVITRVPSAASAGTPSSYSFSDITNPSDAGHTIFIRITSYATSDGSGAYTDHGSVAFATISPFSIGAYVPPFLELCVAITVAPDCSSLSGVRIDLGTLSSTKTSAGQSQFAVGTNSFTGYIIYILGTTMTSGNNVIPALSSPTPSFPGNSQFGINLRNNSIPNIGADPFGSGTGQPTSGYNTPNLYKFASGDAIASSSLTTNYNRMTVSYVVNVSSAQAPGVYASTFTYLATAQF